MSKIVFLDVDGTITNYSNEIPASAIAAIREARANGHRVYMCTGRSRAEIYPELWEIGLDGLIGANGGYVEDDGRVVLHQGLTPAQTAAVVDWLYGRGLEFYLEANSGLYASRDFETVAQPTIRAYAGGKGDPNHATKTIREVFPDMIFGEDPYRDDVNKISFVLGSYQDHLDATERFPDLESRTWGGAGETALFGDLGVKGITKAHAIDVLLAHLDADVSDTMAFGDAAVDIPMLEYCAVGVAMGSGGEEIKAMADHVTDAVDDDGLANAFRHFGLIGVHG